MTKDLITVITCPICRKQVFEIVVLEENSLEIREGNLHCKSCGNNYRIQRGILSLATNLDPITHREQQGHFRMDLGEHGIGVEFNQENIARYKKQFLAIPDEDLSGGIGYFKNVCNLARSFYIVSKLWLEGKGRLLDLGADTCWSTNKFAQMGYQCVALDINHHLIASDIYITIISSLIECRGI